MNVTINQKQFEKDLKKISEKTVTSLNTLVKKYAFDVFTAIVENTPIDTGRAKANYFITKNIPSNETFEGVDKNASLNRLKNVDDNIIPDTWYIVNNLDYIGYLEDGSSIQAPSGFIDLSIQAVNTKFGSLANEL